MEQWRRDYNEVHPCRIRDVGRVGSHITLNKANLWMPQRCAGQGEYATPRLENYRLMLSIIVPACNEEDHIVRCLESVLSQRNVAPAELELIVVANNCSDTTVPQVRALAEAFSSRGWRLEVLDLPGGGKVNALNCGDAVASGSTRAYLDADVVLENQIIVQTLSALGRLEPTYVTGHLNISPAHSWISRRYGDFYAQLPFMQRGSAPGAGWFAVNPAGRARWGLFPKIIADDTYVRWLFQPEERIEVEAGYSWPLVEGFHNLVRVRRRQDAGVRQLRALYPQLETNEGKPALQVVDHLQLFLEDPIGYLVYTSVQILARFRDRDGSEWTRGRR